MGILQPETNEPSSTLQGTQRWLTPSLNEIASMLDKIEGKIRSEDDKWVAIAQSVANQQNAYAEYQADMKKKGVNDQNHANYTPFAKWMSGEPVKGASGNPTPGSEGRGNGNPPVNPTPGPEGIGDGRPPADLSHDSLGADVPIRQSINPLSSISSNMLRNLLGSASVTTENKKAIEAELNSRGGKDKFDIDPTLSLAQLTPSTTAKLGEQARHNDIPEPSSSSTPEVKPVATTTLTEDVAKNYMKQMLDMSPKDRRAFLRENLGPSLFDSAPMLFNIAKEAYGRPGVVGLPDTLEAAHKLSDLYRDMTSLHTALRSDTEAGTTGNVFGRFIDTLSWGLTEEETTKAMKMLKSDSITEKDFAEWHQILASNLGEVAAYGLLAKAISVVGGGVKSMMGGATSTTASKTAQEGKKFVSRLEKSLERQLADTNKQIELGNKKFEHAIVRSGPGYMESFTPKVRSDLAVNTIHANGPFGYPDAPNIVGRAVNYRDFVPDELLQRHKYLTERLSALKGGVTAAPKAAQAVTTPGALVPPVAPTTAAAPKVAQAVPTSTSPVTPLVSNRFTIPEVFNKFKNTAQGREIFKSGMMGKSTQLTQEIIDNAARIVQEGGKVTNGAVKQALLEAARKAAPAAMAAGAYYSPEAEDAMSQIVEQLAALGLE